MARDANYPFAYSKYEGQLVEAKVHILLSLIVVTSYFINSSLLELVSTVIVYVYIIIHAFIHHPSIVYISLYYTSMVILNIITFCRVEQILIYKTSDIHVKCWVEGVNATSVNLFLAIVIY